MRQALKRKARNYPLKHEIKTLVKKELTFIKEGKVEEAVKLLPIAYKAIDTATKKHLIHRKTADRKKSLMARSLNELQKGGKAAKTEKVAA